MCNAWNHPAGCSCGWGGTYYGGEMASATGPSPSSLSSFASFTVPGAHCPVCGADVFFYNSPDGGRVFFDELGPPWPKHPCTDNGDAIRQVEKPSARSYSWLLQGWHPLKVVSAVWVDPRIVQVNALYREVALRLFKPVPRKPKEGGVGLGSLLQAKEFDELRYVVSTVDGMGSEKRFFLYRRSYDAHEGAQTSPEVGKKSLFRVVDKSS